MELDTCSRSESHGGSTALERQLRPGIPLQDIKHAQHEPISNSEEEVQYLNTIRSLANRIDPKMYKNYFEDDW